MDVSANFIAANDIFPNTEKKLDIREQYQIIGRARFVVLKHELNVAHQLYNIPGGVMDEIFDLTSQIDKKYSNWFKSGKKVLKRELKKQSAKEKLVQNDDESLEELTKAFFECKKGVAWKKSVQNFEMDLFQNLSGLHRKLEVCADISRGYVEFYIWERGKKRRIQACHISERVVQKSIANNVLTPMLEPTLIKNNCASQKGKGTHKAWEYFEQDLKKSYKKWGRDFYI